MRTTIKASCFTTGTAGHFADTAELSALPNDVLDGRLTALNTGGLLALANLRTYPDIQFFRHRSNTDAADRSSLQITRD